MSTIKSIKTAVAVC